MKTFTMDEDELRLKHLISKSEIQFKAETLESELNILITEETLLEVFGNIVRNLPNSYHVDYVNIHIGDYVLKSKMDYSVETGMKPNGLKKI